jgi:hypothetical protein
MPSELGDSVGVRPRSNSELLGQLSSILARDRIQRVGLLSHSIPGCFLA